MKKFAPGKKLHWLSQYSLFLFVTIVLFNRCSTDQSFNVAERDRAFDDNWLFAKDSIAGAEAPGYDDSKWRTVDLPHDWSIEDLPNQLKDSIIGPFTKASIGATATGYVEGGIGWYRKKFSLGPDDKNKVVVIRFDGIYMNSDVWINGQHLGNHPYGYTSFYYDITKFCKPPGEENLVAVRVRNEGKNSRWYSGSGIYRHVWLSVTNPLHINQWGVYITTPEVSKETATVRLVTNVLNETEADHEVTLKITIKDLLEKSVAVAEAKQLISKKSGQDIIQTLKINSPYLWSVDDPQLYHAEVEIWSDSKLQDKMVSSFGIRSIHFNTQEGFTLNGEKIELKGGCIHHDNGLLGAAAIDRAEERRIELLKSQGFNAIRCSHNPPSPYFLDACDRLGMLVIDEAFDMWQREKNPQDYHLYFDDWWQRDIQSMVVRDRNHPSVILWSIGNEINERADPSGLDIAKKLKEKVRQFDSTRPVTEAICEFWDHPGKPWSATSPAFALLDVGGYNYQWWNYGPDHEKYPGRIMMGTESVAIHAFQNWQQVEKHPYVIGDFVWTAMDYLGETGIGHTELEGEKSEQVKKWPWFNAWCGDIDLIGNKKPQSYFRDVVWRRSRITMAVHTPLPVGKKERISYWGWPDEQQSWTWPGNKGKMMDVNVYCRGPIVRLFLNGKMMGEKQVSDTGMLTSALTTMITASFKIPYEPGELKAVCIDNGKVVDSFVLITADSPKKIVLKADRTEIKASRNDLSYVTIEVVDDKGRLVPEADNAVEFSLMGNGEIAAVGNADPSDMASFQQPARKAFRGKCLVILRPKGDAGDIVLEAKAAGLESARLVVKTRQ